MKTYLVNAEPIRHSHFSQDPVNVVLHSLLGKTQVICNFLIAKASANQGDKLLFALRQSPLRVLPAIRQLRGLPRHVVEKNFRVVGWTYGMSFGNRADRRYNIHGRGVLQDIAPRTSTNRCQEATPVICHGDQDGFDRLVMRAGCGRQIKVTEQKIQ